MATDMGRIAALEEQVAQLRAALWELAIALGSHQMIGGERTFARIAGMLQNPPGDASDAGSD